MPREIVFGPENKREIMAVAKALGNEVRLNILELLGEGGLNINEIAERLKIPVSTAALHVKVLENAGLIETELQPGIRGSMKLSSRAHDSVAIRLSDPKQEPPLSTVSFGMPIGAFTDCRVEPGCGLVNERQSIGLPNDPRCFYFPDRGSAQLLWFANGFVEYRFPNPLDSRARARLLEFSFEACSEAPLCGTARLSDITVWVGGAQLGTWRSPGNFGGRRGRFNPPWWPDSLPQYGQLKTWRVTSQGSFLDENPISGVTLEELRLSERPFITLRIGLKEGAEHAGGVCLFGARFGDFPQDIVMRMDSGAAG